MKHLRRKKKALPSTNLAYWLLLLEQPPRSAAEQLLILPPGLPVTRFLTMNTKRPDIQKIKVRPTLHFTSLKRYQLFHKRQPSHIINKHLNNSRVG
jgi:hypothetical protein